jgi:hypothetical protein
MLDTEQRAPLKAKCSICGRVEDDERVGRIIACPNSVFVCDRCGFQITAALCHGQSAKPLLRIAFLLFKVVAWPEYYFSKIFMPWRIRWTPPK